MNILKVKLNHVCCNPNCTKGEGGGRKHYFACDYCDRTNSWKSICCSIECFNEFSTLQEKRENNRTDKTDEEMRLLMSTPVEEVKEQTISDLSAAGVDTTDGILAAVDAVNAELDKQNERRKKVRSGNQKVDAD
nr:MAG TPA: hypothetical protein [Caudoviricetes sp.]